MNRKIVCLCGSTKFSEAYHQANLDETLAGNIVLSIGCDMRSDAAIFADKTEDEIKRIKHDLDLLHLDKVQMADEILVLNVDGYIGESTTRELRAAHAQHKMIRWLEPEKKTHFVSNVRIIYSISGPHLYGIICPSCHELSIQAPVWTGCEIKGIRRTGIASSLLELFVQSREERHICEHCGVIVQFVTRSLENG